MTGSPQTATINPVTTPHTPDPDNTPQTSTEANTFNPNSIETNKSQSISFWRLWAFSTVMLATIFCFYSLFGGWVKYLVFSVGMLIFSIILTMWIYWKTKE